MSCPIFSGSVAAEIFVDFFRNDFSATAIAPFSLRAREGAPVAWPITWTDLKNYSKASAIQLHNIDAKLIQRAQKVSEEFLKHHQPGVRNW
jgi:bifunctional non-homologous end joining protein LigD